MALVKIRSRLKAQDSPRRMFSVQGYKHTKEWREYTVTKRDFLALKKSTVVEVEKVEAPVKIKPVLTKPKKVKKEVKDNG